MTLITVSKKEYRKLIKGKSCLSEILRLLLTKKMKTIPKKNDLLELTKLKIRGGPRNLSSKLNFYLYR